MIAGLSVGFLADLDVSFADHMFAISQSEWLGQEHLNLYFSVLRIGYCRGTGSVRLGLMVLK